MTVSVKSVGAKQRAVRVAKLRWKLMGKRIGGRKPAHVRPAKTVSELKLGRVFQSSAGASPK